MLDGALAALADGGGGAVVVEGPPGIGKSVLVEHAVARARRQGVRVLSAAAGQLERDLPYAVVRTLLSTDLPPGPLTDDPGPQVLPGLVRLLRSEVDDGPALVVVDDVHWADDASLRVLDALVRALPPRLALLLTTRTAGPDVERVPVQVVLSRRRLRTLRPAPLSRDAVRALLSAELGGPARDGVVDACVRTTGGNPLLLRQLAHDLRQRDVGPDGDPAQVPDLGQDSVGALVLHRLGRLGAAPRAVARAVAVLGSSASTRSVAALSGLTPDAVVAAAEELVGADVLTRSGRYDFVHPLLHSAVYAHAPAVWRGQAHAQAAWLLHADGADVLDVAAHLLRAEPTGDPRALEVLLAAADRSLASDAVETAVTHLRCALQQAGARRAEVLTALGRAEVRLGDRRAQEHLELALSLADDPGVIAEAATRLARLHVHDGRWDDADAVLRRAVAALPGDAPAPVLLALQGEQLWVLWGRDDWQGYADLLARLPQVPPADTPPHVGRVLLAHRALAAHRRGAPAPETQQLLLQALGEGALLQEQGADSPAWVVSAALLAHNGCRPALERELDAALAETGHPVSALAGVQVRLVRAWAALQEGDLRQADALSAEVLTAARRPGRTPVERYARACRAVALLEQGLDEEAAVLTERAPGGAGPPDRYDVLLLHARALQRARAGALPEAAAMLADVGAWCDARGLVALPELRWRADLAPLLAALGQQQDARDLAAQEEALCRRSAEPFALARALRAVALAAPPPRREAPLREALAVLEDVEAPLRTAEVQVELGAVLRRTGRLVEARSLLHAAEAVAQEAGAAPLALRALRELRLAGGRVRAPAPAGAAGLTAAERQVADLVAQGLSNRAVAAELFVSVKTVEKHLRGAFTKLGVERRSDLAEALGRGAPLALEE